VSERNHPATILEICATENIPIRETDLTIEDVYGADEMFGTGTMGDLAGVVKVGDCVIGRGEIGPLTKRLSDLYLERTAKEGVRVVEQ
jgi:branched-chain amino acid aminotransferase